MKMNVAFICVNYNSYDSLKAYLESIEKAKRAAGFDFKLSVVIVDNSECIKDISKDAYDFEIVHIKSGKNIGYFGGIEFGIKKAEFDLSDYDYSIISNVDVLVSENFFYELNKTIVDSCVGCIAPSIISKVENGNRNPKIVNRISVRKLKVLRIMYRFPLLHILYSNLIYLKRREKVQNAEDGYIYAPHGSFMIFTKRASEFLQTMKYPCFLFGEEIFVAENLMKKGLKVLYKSSLVVNDSEHVSTDKMKSEFYYKCNFEAIDMLLKEYFNE